LSTCIVLSTCDKFRALADFTRTRIGESWEGAPPIRVAGLSGDADALPLRDDPRDWMKVMRSACDDLQAQGFTRAYLILDDHPPLGTCHARHLNETLPAMMDESGAVSVSLSGWGQGRETSGACCKWRGWEFDRMESSHWKFPLHPALWRLDALCGILAHLIAVLPEASRTLPSFERRDGAVEMELPESLTAHSYRIPGRVMAAKKYPVRFEWLRSATDLYRYAVLKIAGNDARAAVDERIMGIHHYYHGPYPLIWRGLMRNGAVNPNALFLFMVGRRNDWIEAVENMKFE